MLILHRHASGAKGETVEGSRIYLDLEDGRRITVQIVAMRRNDVTVGIYAPDCVTISRDDAIVKTKTKGG